MKRRVIPLGLLCFFIFIFRLPASAPPRLTHPARATHRPRLLAVVRGTDYHATRAECDADPLTTASGQRINLKRLRAGRVRWVGISRDLHRSTSPRGLFRFGDTLLVVSSYPEINGRWVVQDLMNARHHHRIDFLRSGAHRGSGDYRHVKLFKN